MKKLPEKLMDDTDKVPGGIPVTGRGARETKDEKAVRYEAQIIAKITGKSLAGALEIAKASLSAKAVSDKRFRDKQQNLARKKKLRRLEGPKKSSYIYKLHGSALPGGLPGLGKRK